MAAFTYTFDPADPAGSDLANTLDTVIQELAQSVKERLALEHVALDESGATEQTSATAQGRHKPGLVSCCYVGTTVQIAALSGVVEGCIVYDTTLAVMKVYTSGAWVAVPMTPTTAGGTLVLDVRLASYAKTAALAILPLNDIYVNTQSAWSLSTFLFTPAVAGTYFFEWSVWAQATWKTQTTYIYKNGVLLNAGTTVVNFGSVHSNSVGSIHSVANGTTDTFAIWMTVDGASTVETATFTAKKI